MKNLYLESCYRRMRQTHRHHQWRLEHGVYLSGATTEDTSIPCLDADLGFILNGRRIMVWWEHPRLRYEALIEELSYQQAGELPSQDLLIGKKNYKQVGRSRKKVTSYSMSFPDSHDHYEKLHALENQLKQTGIDQTVQPSFSVEILPWCKGIDICAPLEIRSKEDLFKLVALTRRLLKRETTLQEEFPDYQYTKQDWLAEYHPNHSWDSMFYNSNKVSADFMNDRD